MGQVGATLSVLGERWGGKWGHPPLCPFQARAGGPGGLTWPISLSEPSQCSQDPRPGHGHKLIYATRERPPISSVTGGFIPTKIPGTPRETQHEIKPSPGVLQGPRQRRRQSCGLLSLKQPS